MDGTVCGWQHVRYQQRTSVVRALHTRNSYMYVYIHTWLDSVDVDVRMAVFQRSLHLYFVFWPQKSSVPHVRTRAVLMRIDRITLSASSAKFFALSTLVDPKSNTVLLLLYVVLLTIRIILHLCSS